MLIKLASLVICLSNDNLTNTTSTPPPEVVLNLILSKGYFYYFCEEFKGHSTQFNGSQQCTLFCILLIFNDFDKKIDFNQHNPLFLKSYHSKLFQYLIEIFYV